MQRYSDECIWNNYRLIEALSPHLLCALVQSCVINHLEIDIPWLSQNEGIVRSVAVLILDA